MDDHAGRLDFVEQPGVVGEVAGRLHREHLGHPAVIRQVLDELRHPLYAAEPHGGEIIGDDEDVSHDTDNTDAWAVVLRARA